MVKNHLALLERIPNPETGFRYKDIVKVKGPVGTQLFRDDLIKEYEVIEIHKSSEILTFSFEVIIPHFKEYFEFIDWFKKNGERIEIPWSTKENDQKWRKGYCTGQSLEHTEQVLTQFIRKKKGLQIKNLRLCRLH